VPPLGALVNDLDNLVNKNDNFILETLSSLGELPDATETEHKFDSLTLSVEI
jgi:hypothetical protein